MSIIFGIIKHNNEIVTMQEMQNAYSSIAHFPQDNHSLWHSKNAGLGWVQRFDTPESVFDKQPLSWNNGIGTFSDYKKINELRNVNSANNERFTFVGKARLDNRDELCSIFNVPENEKANIPDTGLIIQAFEKWGHDCTKKLLGDWAFAVWDSFEKRVFVARDHLGVTSMFYAITDKFFAFSSSIHVLLSLQGVSKEINMLYIAQLLTGWSGFAGSTSYKYIFRIPPSNAGYFANNQLKLNEFWNIQQAPDIYLSNDDEYIDACDEIFTKAVKSRIRSYRQIGTTLSSGLDSGSVTVMAASLLAKEQKVLKAYTHVPIFETEKILKQTSYGNEGPLAALIAKMHPNIEHFMVNSENRNSFKGILDSFEIHQGPVRNASNQYWIISILEMVKNAELGTLLTGQSGNYTLSWPFRGYYNRIMDRSIKGYVRRHTPFYLLQLWYNIRKGKQPFLNYSVIKPEFAEEMELLSLMRKNGYDPHFISKSSLKQARYHTFNTSMIYGGALWQEAGDYFGINIYDPTIDIKLLEFCTGIPDNQFMVSGKDRYLIRRLMKNRLPDKILYNEKVGKQSADLFFRIKDEEYLYKETINKMLKSNLCSKTIDINEVTEVLSQLEKGNIESIKLISGFLRGISIGNFLINQK